MESLVKIRDRINHWLYANIVRKIAFIFEAEDTHLFFIKLGKILGRHKIMRKIIHSMYYYESPLLEQTLLGIKFKSPVGLAAGFDKNAEIINICEDLGFGFSEIGSLTKLKHAGNPGKRLKRIKEKRSLWVNLGLNNNGTDAVASRLKNKKYKIPFGVSIAKTNCRETAVDDIVGRDDYLYSLKRFNAMNIGDFYVLNISCPNSYGGLPFSRPKQYESLLKESDKLRIKKPIFIKLSPDSKKKEIDRILQITKKHRIDGFIISNLKKSSSGVGGFSGKLVEKQANNMIKYVYSKTKGKYLLIGVGGIFSAKDAYEKIKCGANLVQLITGMIYEGPNIISEINYGLAELLRKDGFANISEAVGFGSK